MATKELKLILDVLKAGFSNTNDGNTSPKCFNNVDLTAKITKISIHFIYRIQIILQTITCEYTIDTQKISNYTVDIAKSYIE